jgi:hypothetical protein
LSSDDSSGPPRAVDRHFAVGIEDAVILPLVMAALAARRILKAALTLLIDIIDIAFPILLQVMRFPLFTLRMLGDGGAWLLKGIVRILPIGGTRRAAWREAIGRTWTWLRSKISYRAFERRPRARSRVSRRCRCLARSCGATSGTTTRRSAHPRRSSANGRRTSSARWSVKFTAQYYEAKDREEMLKSHKP